MISPGVYAACPYRLSRASTESSAIDSPYYYAVLLDPFSHSEVEHGIGRLKLNKAAGPDDLPPIVFKFERLTRADEMHEKSVPTHQSRFIIVPIFHRGSCSECGSHERISLISIGLNLLASVILHEMSDSLGGQIPAV